MDRALTPWEGQAWVRAQLQRRDHYLLELKRLGALGPEDDPAALAAEGQRRINEVKLYKTLLDCGVRDAGTQAKAQVALAALKVWEFEGQLADARRTFALKYSKYRRP
jgi:hypothetical protein